MQTPARTASLIKEPIVLRTVPTHTRAHTYTYIHIQTHTQHDRQSTTLSAEGGLQI